MKGNVNVESKKPNDGTMALIQGRSISMALKYSPIARYVNKISTIFLVQLPSHALSDSTFLFLCSIFSTLSSRVDMFELYQNTP